MTKLVEPQKSLGIPEGPSKEERIKQCALAAKAQGKDFFMFAGRYNYAGTVAMVGGHGQDAYLVLEGAKFPVETGAFSEKKWREVEDFPTGIWDISISFIESWGTLK